MRALPPILVLALVLSGAPGVRAADDPEKVERVKTVVLDLAALRKAKDATGFQGQLKDVVALHNELADAGLKGKLQKELGGAVKAKGMEAVQSALVEAISELNDAKGAFKLLKKLLPTAKDEEVEDVQRQAIQAAGKLASDDALDALFELAEKAKDRDSGAAAISALGHFGVSKKRLVVLEELVKYVLRFIPPVGVTVGEDTLKRWEALGPPLLGALNQLTGQKVMDPNEWMALYKEHKKQPEALFVDAGE